MASTEECTKRSRLVTVRHLIKVLKTVVDVCFLVSKPLQAHLELALAPKRQRVDISEGWMHTHTHTHAAVSGW